MATDPDDPFGPPGFTCFDCGCHIPNGEGITPDGLIVAGIIGRVFCRECWEASKAV